MTKHVPKKIIIIGAGIAGLAAFKHLTDRGYDVMILEGRDRCGGRIWSDNSFGFPFGLGASWIHGAMNNPIAKLANDANANMAIVDPNKFVIFNQQGNVIAHDETTHFNKKFQGMLDQAKALAFKAKQDISLSAALADILKQYTLTITELAILKTKLASLEGYYGASNDSLSARYWDIEEPWPGDNCYLISSYQPIIDNLAKGDSIKLNTSVKEVNMRENDVEIVTNDTIFYANAVIITVPLGVLKNKDITFNPPLPDDKQKVIENLGMGLFNITALKFSKAFWPKENHVMIFTQSDATSIPVFFNLHHFISEPILVGFRGGNLAKELERLSDDEIIERTIQNFKKTFGIEIPEPESYLNTRWSLDPFSRGSYSFTPTGASGDDYDTVAKPVLNRLFFAGEATSSKYPATTHGAYLSGIREAERILKCDE
jgi:polyamine oxidase